MDSASPSPRQTAPGADSGSAPVAGDGFPDRYVLRERDGLPVLTCREAPGIAVRIERDFAFSEAEARRLGERTILLDGAGAFGPLVDDNAHLYNLDHHQGCVRALHPGHLRAGADPGAERPRARQGRMDHLRQRAGPRLALRLLGAAQLPAGPPAHARGPRPHRAALPARRRDRRQRLRARRLLRPAGRGAGTPPRPARQAAPGSSWRPAAAANGRAKAPRSSAGACCTRSTASPTPRPISKAKRLRSRRNTATSTSAKAGWRWSAAIPAASTRSSSG